MQRGIIVSKWINEIPLTEACLPDKASFLGQKCQENHTTSGHSLGSITGPHRKRDQCLPLLSP